MIQKEKRDKKVSDGPIKEKGRNHPLIRHAGVQEIRGGGGKGGNWSNGKGEPGILVRTLEEEGHEEKGGKQQDGRSYRGGGGDKKL